MAGYDSCNNKPPKASHSCPTLDQDVAMMQKPRRALSHLSSGSDSDYHELPFVPSLEDDKFSGNSCPLQTHHEEYSLTQYSQIPYHTTPKSLQNHLPASTGSFQALDMHIHPLVTSDRNNSSCSLYPSYAWESSNMPLFSEPASQKSDELVLSHKRSRPRRPQGPRMQQHIVKSNNLLKTEMAGLSSQNSYCSQYSENPSTAYTLPRESWESNQLAPLSIEPYFALKTDPLITLAHLPLPPIRHPELSLAALRNPQLNSFSKTKMIKIEIIPCNTSFVAGGELFGRMDLIIKFGKSSDYNRMGPLTIGEIGIELLGYEEVQSRPSHPSRAFVFLQSRHLFQLPSQTFAYAHDRNFETITSTVLFPHPPPDDEGYREAKEGTYSFPFTFYLPKDCPPSVEMQVARIKYVVTGYMKIKISGSPQIVERSESVSVADSWDTQKCQVRQPVGITVTGHGLFVSAKIQQPLVQVEQEIMVDVSRVRLQLIDAVILLGDKRGKPEIEGEEMTSVEDKEFESVVVSATDKEHIIPGQSGLGMKWTMRLPTKDASRTISNAAMFRVSQYIVITVPSGRFSKTLHCKIPPLSIVHSHSLTNNPPISDAETWANVQTLYSQRLVQKSKLIETSDRPPIKVIQPDFYVDSYHRTRLYDQPDTRLKRH